MICDFKNARNFSLIVKEKVMDLYKKSPVYLLTTRKHTQEKIPYNYYCCLNSKSKVYYVQVEINFDLTCYLIKLCTFNNLF